MRHAYADVFDRSTSAHVSPLVFGTLTVGTLDLVSCSAFWALRDVPMWRIAQGPASWLLGAQAFSMGTASVLLGLVVLYTMAALSVAGYQHLARLYPALRRAPLRWGAAYGAFLYALLLWVVIPLSAAPRTHHPEFDWLATLLLIYMFLIGIPCALFARWNHSLR